MLLKALKDFKPGDARHKLLPFTQTAVKASTGTDEDVAGEIEGYAAGLLNIDRGQDIIFPGAFDKDLPAFLSDGVVCYQHDWTAVIGTCLEAEERLEPDYGLFTRSEITATSLGEDVMKLVRRKVLKKLSIGYRLKQGGYSVLNRETLEATLKERKINPVKVTDILSDFDRRKLSEVFGLFDVELYEYSVVTRPMNPNADITGSKADLMGEGEGGLLDGLPFSVHPLVVLGAVKGYAERVRESKLIYSGKDRNLSATHKEGIKQVREELERLLPEVKELEALANEEIAPQDEVNRVIGEALRMEATLNGVSLD